MRLNETQYRIADCETSGLEPATAGVCEFAYADMQPDGHVTRRYAVLLNPGHPIPPTASAIHHIVDEDVQGCPFWASVRDQHHAPVYVAHNADFDKKFLELPGVWICSYRLAKHLWPELPGHGNEAIRYALKLEVDAPKDSASHRAAHDVAVTTAIFKRALAEVRERWNEVETIEQLIERINQPCLLRVVPFKSANGCTFEDAETSLLQWIISRGAGGEDCVYSAQHWLNKRFGGGERSLLDEQY